ncbi:hypothetical protein BACCIP111883_04472 [Sutcliffiella rhizosphaerae]|uniref:SDR family NAD(P)-dependent oxidoreductase n=1 Tax=Sutcliffiella rhizosphaerae TaxID=2880967 RepID=A0ABN8AHC4_9BACI|nr:hypothetical protein BACCIP111883_04472 [Sutcliffiella rhizosphaerae]
MMKWRKLIVFFNSKEGDTYAIKGKSSYCYGGSLWNRKSDSQMKELMSLSHDISEQRIQDTVKEIEQLKGRALGVKTDVSKLTDIEHLIQTTLDSFQTLDILVNNAGILDRLTPVTEITDEFWEKNISINLTAPMRLSREAIKKMVEKGQGNIINMSSLGCCMEGKPVQRTQLVSIVGLQEILRIIMITKEYVVMRLLQVRLKPNLGINEGVNPFGLERFQSGAGANIRFWRLKKLQRLFCF